MFRASFITIALLIAVIVSGGVFLATWDIPSPSELVNKPLPDDRFPQ